jgi:hypothetical protein
MLRSPRAKPVDTYGIGQSRKSTAKPVTLRSVPHAAPSPAPVEDNSPCPPYFIVGADVKQTTSAMRRSGWKVINATHGIFERFMRGEKLHAFPLLNMSQFSGHSTGTLLVCDPALLTPVHRDVVTAARDQGFRVRIISDRGA